MRKELLESIGAVEEVENRYDKDLVISKFLSGEVVINDHTDKQEEVEALVELNGENRPLCQFIPNVRYQSLNKVYSSKEDMGELHISMESIGGCFTGDLTQKNVEKYNKSCIFDSFKIKRVILRDGSCIIPA